MAALDEVCLLSLCWEYSAESPQRFVAGPENVPVASVVTGVDNLTLERASSYRMQARQL